MALLIVEEKKRLPNWLKIGHIHTVQYPCRILILTPVRGLNVILCLEECPAIFSHYISAAKNGPSGFSTEDSCLKRTSAPNCQLSKAQFLYSPVFSEDLSLLLVSHPLSS